MKRIIIAIAAIISIILCNSNSAQACDKTPECYSTATIVMCGTLYGAYAYTHVVTEPNGHTYGCSVYSESSTHTIKCAGCNAYLGSEARICNMKHSHSRCQQGQNGLCQR